MTEDRTGLVVCAVSVKAMITMISERSQPSKQLRRPGVAKQINAILTGRKALNTAHYTAPLWGESCHKRDANTAKIRRSFVQKRSVRRDNGREDGGRSRGG